MSTAAESVGRRVRRLREQRGMSQGQLARPGLSASYLSLIEADRRAPTSRALDLLAGALGCTTEELRDGPPAGRREEHDLRVSWAEIALGNGSPQEGLDGVRTVLAEAELDERTRWRAQLVSGLCLESLNQLEEAIEVFDALRTQAERDPARWPWLSVVIALCRCYREVGDLSYSIELAEQSLARVDEMGVAGCDEHAEVASTLIASYYERGDLARAALLSRQLIDRTASWSPRAQVAAYWNASIVAQEQGRFGEALRLADEALARLSAVGTARNAVRLQVCHAALLLRVEPREPAEALALLERLAPEIADLGSQVDIASAETETARAHLQLGDHAAAVVIAQRAVERLGDRPRLETAQALIVLGLALRAGGEVDTAAVRLRHAAQLLDVAQPGRQSASAWHELADVLLELGEADEAIRAYQRSLAAIGVQPTELVTLDRPGAGRAGSGARDA